MLGILSESFKIATRIDHWESSRQSPMHETELLEHERRKGTELRRQIADKKRFFR